MTRERTTFNGTLDWVEKSGRPLPSFLLIKRVLSEKHRDLLAFERRLSEDCVVLSYFLFSTETERGEERNSSKVCKKKASLRRESQVLRHTSLAMFVRNW